MGKERRKRRSGKAKKLVTGEEYTPLTRTAITRIRDVHHISRFFTKDTRDLVEHLPWA